MNISSKDIKKRDFKKGLRGYDANEVDAFLDTVSSHYEKLIIENKNQEDKIKSLLSDIEIYKDNEANLQKAIIKSQDLGEEIVQNAKKKAEMIIKESELNSRKMKQDIEDDILSKKQELEDIKNRNDKIIEDVKNFLSDKLNELENFIKNKKIFKMELTKLSNITSDFDELAEQDEELKSQEEKPIKKVFIGGSKPDKSSFEDSFEVK
ncbi:MAG: DivIVA domain-containing protein [Ignavibacteria bacterium]|jgi:cell division initiation protein